MYPLHCITVDASRILLVSCTLASRPNPARETAVGLANIALAVLAAFGFGGYVGLLFSPLMNLLPFILVGIGVDGMFVLQSAMDYTDPRDLMEERVGKALQYAGVSVATASLTNFGAFMIGSATALPALGAFATYAALAILFDLIFQVRLPSTAAAESIPSKRNPIARSF
jgi:predicted RND superfamily exporter protein